MRENDSFDNHGREEAINALISLFEDPDIRQRCVRGTSKHFSLDDGVATYDRIYRELAPT